MKQRILTLCAGGNVRSAAMAWRLKNEGIDAVPAGLVDNSPEFIVALGRLVDKVIVMDKDLLPRLPPELLAKVVLADVGPDIWGNPLHPDLVRRVHSILKAWNGQGHFSDVSLRPIQP